MTYQRRKRLAGNLCLMLMASMLVLAVAMLVVPATPALAQPNTDPVTVNVSSPITPEGDAASGYKLTVNMNLTPSTGTTYESVVVRLKIYDLPEGVTSEDVKTAVYTEVYGQGELTAVTVVYQSIYNVAGGFTMPVLQVAGATAVGDMVYKVIYVDLVLKPPRPSEGAQPAVVSPEVVTTPTDAGLVTVDRTTASASFTPVPEKIESLLQTLATTAPQTGGTSFTLFNATDLGVSNLDVALTTDLFNVLSQPQNSWVQSLSVVAPDMSVDLPMDALWDIIQSSEGEQAVSAVTAGIAHAASAAPVRSAGIKVAFSALDDSKSAERLAAVQPDPGATVASRVFSLDLWLTRYGQVVNKITSLKQPMLAKFVYKTAPGLKEHTLTAYRATADNRWQPVGGWPVYKDRQVYAPIWETSQFVVMGYDKVFDDSQSHWAQPNIELLAGRRVVNGVTDRLFDPEGTVTRAQFAAMAVRLLGLPERKGTAPTFTDVKPEDWFYGAVETAANFGVVKGMGDGTFRPNDEITREQLAVMIVNAMKVAGKPSALKPGELEGALSRFADSGQISEWAREQVALCVTNDIVRGRSAASFGSLSNATRAEAATMLTRLLKYLGRY